MITQNPTVAEYVVGRLADLGIRHVFGVPGDFSFPIDDAVLAHPDLTWIGSSNELNAAYAADGYARLRGAAMLSTTYAVGELSALNGVMGSRAERLPVFHLIGAPSSRIARARRPMHHTLGDGEYGQFSSLTAATACASTLLTPVNAIVEMERVISAAAACRQPVTIHIPQDYALMPVIGRPVNGFPLGEICPFSSDAGEIEAAVKAILKRLAQARQPVILPSFTLSRYGLTKSFESFLVATGIPFATTPLNKAVVSESHPQYMGIYAGQRSEPALLQFVEEADLVLDVGGIIFDDLSTGLSSTNLGNERIISIWPDHVTIGVSANKVQTYSQSFSPVWMGEVLDALTREVSHTGAASFPHPVAGALNGEPHETVSYFSLSSRVQRFLQPGDVFLTETGTASIMMSRLLLPDGCVYQNQTLWGSIGWATPAAFGAALAAPERRVVLVTGDGSHQLTATEIGVMGRYGVKPIIIVINNSLYGIEEFFEGNRHEEYNKLAPWHYAGLPEVMGCKGWYCVTVQTNAELDEALQTACAHDGACYIEAVLGEKLLPALPAEMVESQYQTRPPE